MKKRQFALLSLLLVLCASSSEERSIHGASNVSSFLRQQNVFGLTGSAWQDTANYYVPGTGSPAVSTADYYHSNGVAWMRPYDLTAADCGSAGASIAASRGRYVWFMSADHPAGGFNWNGGNSFRIGFSSDPGVLPSRMEFFYSDQTVNPTATIATFNGFISGTTLTANSPISGLIMNDNHATLTGAGVAANTRVVSQLSGTAGGAGTYTVSVSQTVGSVGSPVSLSAYQTNYNIYQNPGFFCNPDDASFPFYVSGEGAASSVLHEQGYIKSADLVTWSATPTPSHVTLNFDGWSSFQNIVRDGVNSWHSVGLEVNYPQNGTIFGRSKWTSTDGKVWVPGTVAINQCLPTSAQNPSNFEICLGASSISVGQSAAPPFSISGQSWSIGRLNTYTSGSRIGPQWAGRVPIDANFNTLDSPAAVKVSTAYAGYYPGPTYVQDTFGYIEDGIAHYYASIGFLNSSSLFGLTDAATYANGGGLWQQALDYYTEIIDATAAAGAAPIGVRASCASSVASLTWYNALPTQTYRLYRGTTAGSQTTLVGDFTGTTATDPGMTLNAVTYYKLVYLNGGTEQKNSVVSTYCSTSSAQVNAHITRCLAAGCDSTTIDRTWLDSFDSWHSSNGLSNNLMLATMVDFGTTKDGSNVISKIFDYGTTRLPRGGDYTPMTTSTTYSATGINSKPAWLNANSSAKGYYGGGPGYLNNIRRKTQITILVAYQKSHTNQIMPLVSGQFGSRIYLSHDSGSPGTISAALFDATQQKIATAPVIGLATDFHTAALVFDGTNLIAYSDGIAGTPQSGLIIPSPNLNPPDGLTGQVTVDNLTHVLVSGDQGGLYSRDTNTFSSQGNAAQFNGAAIEVLDKGLSASQVLSWHNLIRTHQGF